MNEPKKNFYKLSSWDFFFKTSTITLYENANDLKFRFPNEEKKLFYFWTLKPLKRPNSLLVWIDQKNVFFQLCYLIRVEHEKFSEMCVRIVRFGLKLRKWDHF